MKTLEEAVRIELHRLPWSAPSVHELEGDGADGPRDDGAPRHGEASLPPPPDLASLTAEAWRTLKLPPRDHLMGTALCTTSRWMIIGDTGIGKTLVAMPLGMAVASNRRFLNWEPCGKPRVVMYIDGDLPAETFQERMILMEAIYGAAEMKFYAYNLDKLQREDLGFEPFNTDAGRAWLEREIQRVKPDLIIFDSVMCLTINAMADDRAWAPVANLIAWLSSRRIGQIWLHHTGHDPTRGFGTKSREWRLDTVITLLKDDESDLVTEEGAPIDMRFKKARLRTPQNRDQFEDRKIAFGQDGWRSVSVLVDAKPKRGDTDKRALTRYFCDTYDRLADGLEPSGRSAGYKIFKVNVDRIRDEMKSAGWLDVDDQGRIAGKDRTAFHSVKRYLLEQGGFQEKDKLIWRTKPPPTRQRFINENND